VNPTCMALAGLAHKKHRARTPSAENALKK
jgi:hypothetical protein